MKVSACTSVCVCACLSFMAGQTAGPIVLKFGMVMPWEPGSVMGGWQPASEAVWAANEAKNAPKSDFRGEGGLQQKSLLKQKVLAPAKTWG